MQFLGFCCEARSLEREREEGKEKKCYHILQCVQMLLIIYVWFTCVYLPKFVITNYISPTGSILRKIIRHCEIKQLHHIIYALKLFARLCYGNGLLCMGFYLKLPYPFCNTDAVLFFVQVHRMSHTTFSYIESRIFILV